MPHSELSIRQSNTWAMGCVVYTLDTLNVLFSQQVVCG